MMIMLGSVWICNINFAFLLLEKVSAWKLCHIYVNSYCPKNEKSIEYWQSEEALLDNDSNLTDNLVGFNQEARRDAGELDRDS